MGQWEMGDTHGEGSMRWPDGSTYVGGFSMGKRSGEGMLTWADGRQYRGQWVNNKQHGIGETTDINGIIKNYQWRDGKPVTDDATSAGKPVLEHTTLAESTAEGNDDGLRIEP